MPGAPTLDWPSHGVEARRHDGRPGDQEAMLESLGSSTSAAGPLPVPTEVGFGDEVRSPDAVVIATGARTPLPDLPASGWRHEVGVALSYPTLPQSLVIVARATSGPSSRGRTPLARR